MINAGNPHRMTLTSISHNVMSRWEKVSLDEIGLLQFHVLLPIMEMTILFMGMTTESMSV
jgi:hypothetical protein